MPRRVHPNALTVGEVALVKTMIRAGNRTDQEIQAYFTRPNRNINHARILEIRQGRRHPEVPVASHSELRAFLQRWPEHDHVTGLHHIDDELVVKAREAMLNAIQIYNNPRAFFRSECFIVLAVIAWTYLLHHHLKLKGIDYRTQRADGSFVTTTHGAFKHWALETCLDLPDCPIEAPAVANLRNLILVRHEIEHQMTRRIDDSLSAKIQACCLNFNTALKQIAGTRCSLDRDISFAIQLSGIDREQRNLLLRDMDLPRNLVAAQEMFEDALPDEITRDQRYAWRVILIHKNTNSKGAADEVVEFIKPGSDLEGSIHRVLQKEVEKTKYRPSDIVSAVKDAGFPLFNQRHHTLLVRELDAKSESKAYGAFVDLKRQDWRWYRNWLDAVIVYCRKQGNLFVVADSEEPPKA
jgi:Protein of unknown function (DUF3644)